MPANSRYITSAIQSFSTFLKHKDVSHDVHEAAVLAFMRVLEYKNDFSSWELEKYDAFQAQTKLFESFSPVVLGLLREFIITYPPYQISVYLQEYLLALASEHCSHSTIKNYRSDIEQFIVFAHETEIDSLLSKPKILSFLKYEQAKGLKDTSIYRKLVSITQFLFWAYQTGATQRDGAWVNKVKTNFSVFLASNLKDLADSSPQKTEIESHNDLSSGKDTVPSRSLPKTGFTKHFATLLPKTSKAIIQPPHLSSEKNARQLQEYRTQLHNQLSRLSNKVASKTPGRLLTYFNLALIALLVTGAAYFAYAQFFSNANRPLAYPDTPTAPYRSLSFQGRLTDTAQNPITTATDMSFKLFDAPSGGAELWDSTTCSITPDQDGIFSVGLGDECGTEITEDVFSENASVYLEVTIESETLDPRQPIKAVAYALNSETLQGYPIDATGAATMSTVVTMNQYGEVVLGEFSPKLRSVSGTFSIEAQALTLQTTSGSNGDINLSPDGTGEINLNADTIIDGYLYAPGATLSATYAGGTALTLRAGPSATADILQWQNSASSVLGVIDEAGNLGVGTSNPGYKLEVAGTVNVTGNASFEANTFFGNATSDTVAFTARIASALIPSLSGSYSLGSSSQRWNQLFTSNNGIKIGADLNDATISYDGTSLNFDPDSNSTIDVIFSDGGNVGIGTTFASQKLHVEGDFQLTGALYDSTVDAGTPGYILSSTGSGTDWIDPATISDAANFWEISSGALYPKNSTTDLLIGGTATDSAKFAFINVDSGTPTASISGNLALAVPTGSTPATKLNIYNGGTFGIRTSVGGDVGLTERLTILNGGNVGIGTTNPSALFSVGTSSQLQVDSGGLIIGSNAGSSSITSSVSSSNTVLTLRGTSSARPLDLRTANTTYLRNLRESDGATLAQFVNGTIGGVGNVLGLQGSSGAALGNTSGTYFLASNATGTILSNSVSTTAPTGRLDIRTGSDSTIGQVIRANSGTQTANLTEWQNSSGTALTVVDEVGNIGIGSTSPGMKLDVNGDIRAASGSDFYVASVGLNDNGSTSSGASLVGLFDDSMTYISSNTNVQSAIKQLDTAIGTVSGANYWQRVAGNLSPLTTSDTLSATSSAATVATFTSTGTNNAFQAGNTTNYLYIDSGGNLIPSNDVTMNLGESELRFNELFIGGGTIDMGTDGDSGLFGYSVASDYFSFDPDNDATAEFVMTDTGNFGIGTLSPGMALDVNGDIRAASGSDFYVGSIGLNDNGSTSSGASLVGLFDDSMTYISSNTNVQSAIKQLDTAIGTVSGGNYWQRVAGNLSPLNLNDTISATTSASVAMTLTQTGAFNALLVQDQASDTSPFIINQDGNVGIGTSNPSYIADIADRIRIRSGSGGAAGMWLSDSSSNDRAFIGLNDDSASPKVGIYNSGWRLIVDSVGNVGIGSISPNQKLDVVGDGVFSGNVGIGTVTPAYKADITDRIRIRSGSGTAGMWLSDSSSNDRAFIGLNDDSASPKIGLYNSDWRLIVDSVGNVGIGDTTPTYKLDVNGTGRFAGAVDLDGDLELNSTLTDINGSVGTSGQILSSTATGVDWIDAPSGGAVAWNDITDPSGNLALNMTTNTTTFNWDTGTSTNDLFSLTTDASSNGTGSLLNIQTGASSTVVPLRVRAGATEALYVTTAGNIGVGTTTASSKLDVNGTGRFTGAVDLDGDLELNSTLTDINSSVGTSGQILSSTATGVDWIDAPAATSLKWNALTVPDGNLSLAMDADTTSFSYNTLTSGTGWSLNSSATAFTGTLSDITLSGSNAANTGTLLALNNTGTSNANTSMLINHYATGTNNLALRVNDVSGDTTPFIIDGTGNVGIGTTTIAEKLTIEGNVLLTTGANRVLSVADVSSGNGYNLEVSAADTSAVSGVGGNLSLLAGTASAIGTTTGGDVLIAGGSAAPDLGVGGNVYIYGGSAFDDGHVFLAHDGSSAFGNVSIGTTGTTEKLTVDGNILVNRFIDTSGSGSYFLDPAAGTTSLVVAGNIGIASTSPAFALDVNGTFRASGASQFDGNLTLGNATTDQLVFTGRVNSNILPISDGTYDLGSSALRWNALYVKGSSIHLGDAGNESILGYSGTALTFDANGDSTPDYSISDSGNTTTTGWVRGNNVVIGGRDAESGCSNFTNIVCGATDLWLGTDGGSIYLEDAVNVNDQNITNIDNLQIDNNVGIGTTGFSSARLHVRGAVTTGLQIEDATTYGMRVTNLASNGIGIRLDTTGASGTGIVVNSVGTAGEFTSSAGDAIVGSGTWRGNVSSTSYTTAVSGNASTSITNKALVYYINLAPASQTATGTITFNITGLSNTEGSFAIIRLNMDKPATIGSNVLSYSVQINGSSPTMLNGSTTSTTAAQNRLENALVVYAGGAWVLASNSTTVNTADLAEWLEYNGVPPMAGQIMALVDNTKGEISSESYQPALAGVVSTAPHTTMGPELPNSIPLALAGRVPVIVTTKNGALKPGDYITSSDYTGTGMKARFAGQVVGKAMESTESWATASCPVVSNINNIPWPDDDGTNPNKPCFTLPNGDIIGKIMMLIDNSWYEGSINIDEAGEIRIADATQGYQVTEVGSSNPLTRISVFSQTIIGQVKAGLVNTKDLVVEETASIANLSVESLQINGQSLADYIASIVGNGQPQGTPSGQTTGNNNQSIELVDKLQMTDDALEIQNTNEETVASVDNSGNATFSGQISSRLALLEQVQTDNITATTATISGTTTLGSLLTDTASVAGTLTAQDATIAGTLTASSARLELLEGRVAELQSIKAQTAELMDATISGTLYAQNIDDFENRVNQAINQPSLLQALLNQLPQNPAPPEAVIPPIEAGGYIATGAGELNLSLEDLELDSDDVALLPTAVFIDQYLKVNGIAYVADQLGVGNRLLVGDGLQLGDGTIAYNPSSTEAPLFKIQPSGKGSLELMAGLMTLDESGVVTVTGNLAIAGNLSVQDTLLTDLLQPTDFGNPFQVQVAGLSTESGQIKQSRFEIVNEYRVPVATISASGRAEFADGIGIGSEDLGQGDTLNSSQSSGRATIGANTLEVIINSTKITPNSLIYITPMGSTNNSVMYLKSQTPEDSGTSEKEGKFVVGFDEVLDRDVTFNWWIVN